MDNKTETPNAVEQTDDILKKYIGRMFGSLEAASIEHFLKTGTISGSFRFNLVNMLFTTIAETLEVKEKEWHKSLINGKEGWIEATENNQPMTNIFVYQKDSNTIKEKATMEKPDWKNKKYDFRYGEDKFEDDLEAYNQHIVSLKSYPCSDNSWVDGQELIENIHLKIGNCNDCKIGDECKYVKGKWMTPCKKATPIHSVEEDKNNKCSHEFISREYKSQPYGTCSVCGKTIID